MAKSEIIGRGERIPDLFSTASEKAQKTALFHASDRSVWHNLWHNLRHNARSIFLGRRPGLTGGSELAIRYEERLA